MSPDLYLIPAWIGRVGVIIAWLVPIREAASRIADGRLSAGPLLATVRGNVIISMLALLLFQ
jgi:hypothetical protein